VLLAQQPVAHSAVASGAGIEHRTASVAFRDDIGFAKEGNAKHCRPYRASSDKFIRTSVFLRETDEHRVGGHEPHSGIEPCHELVVHLLGLLV
jgi:hypothetical protein